MSTHPSLPASRRSFLRIAGLAAVAVAGTAAASGCSSAVAELRSAGEPVGDGTPVRGGTLRVGVLADLVAGAVMTGTNNTQMLTTGVVFDRLVEYSGEGLDPRPSLATEWSRSDDGLTYTLRLRPDVRFHTGREFTSADAEFALRTYADPVWTAQLRSTAAAIVGYDSTDPHVLVLTLARPIGNLFDLLSMVPMIDSESVDELLAGTAYVGTGPFRFASRTPNARVVFERNDDYWEPERPYLDAIEMNVIPDATALLSSVRAGRIDLSGDLTFRDANNLARLGGFRVVDLAGATSNTYVGVNVAATPLDDVRLRQVIAYAVDRERIVEEVYRGSARAANLPWPADSPAYDESKDRRYALDRDAARALVAELGALPSLPLTYPAGSPTYEVVAQIVQANLADVGVTVDLDPVEQTVAVQRLIGGEFAGLWILQHGFAQYTPSTLTVSAYPFNARKNASNYVSDTYLAAAESAWQIADGTGPEAIERYADLNDALLDGLFLVELAVIDPRTVLSARVGGFAWNRRAEPLLANAYLS
ncbi:peptide/nickel transport system substrate-binding protein [Rhodococcus triatomae]|uniref:Peptide/nickel transport system substrate-binding protein n=1 Tax=Rhodococcus triatomae TaxID=300028 RepID=A0A1G8DFB1_9NOCA|nr:ABC transporter substrate-binding protein [Rhodococcus triatomae]SDH56274.1 peptide/nickel transport system substrate-binding protein [Rhodococcus triatomae]